MTMVAWQILEPTEHRAAIAGRAIDAMTKLPIAGVKITITTMPASFQQWLSLRALSYGDSWESLIRRPDRVTTKEDGFFHFMDLPDGVYTLSFSVPRQGSRYGTAQQDFAVVRDVNGNIALTIQPIELTPTGASGKVLGYVAPGDPNTLPLPMALIRVLGSGEQTYSGPDGGYAVVGVDPGGRHLSITAPGYQPATRTTTIVKGQITVLTDIVLDPTP
jgi:hypothetical protein